jgi:hypothetical protein
MVGLPHHTEHRQALPSFQSHFGLKLGNLVFNQLRNGGDLQDTRRIAIIYKTLGLPEEGGMRQETIQPRINSIELSIFNSIWTSIHALRVLAASG